MSRKQDAAPEAAILGTGGLNCAALPDGAVAIAHFSAGIAVENYIGGGRCVDPWAWPALGAGDADDNCTYALAGFVRANPTAPAEALWRWAHGQGIHSADVDGYHDADFAWWLAYRVFADVLLTVDEALRVRASIAAARAHLSAGPVTPAAFLEDPEDTIMAQHADPLALNRGFALARTSEDVPPVSDEE